MTPAMEPIAILIAALGGQGGGVLAEWLVDAARLAGFPAQSTSIPGVAQRTGATTYYVEIFPQRADALAGRAPVLSLYPTPGAVDVVIASELLESARVVQAGLVSRDRTTLITSTSRMLTTAEKMSLGDGRFASERLIAVGREHSRRYVALDMEALAREADTVINAVMLGAIAGADVLPIPRATLEAVIRERGVGVEGSLRGLARGFAAMTGGSASVGIEVAPSSAPLPALASSYPSAVRPMVALGVERLTAFQDATYAARFEARVRRILAVEQIADPVNRHGDALTREAARFLALWMAFDDIVRVAMQKCRASRFARVRREVGAADGDIVRIADHFKPGVAELAGILPMSWGARLLAWERKRKARGRAPLAVPMRLRADSVLGFAMLRFVAALRVLRPRGWRFAEEQAAIERWLDAIEQGAREDWRLGNEIALCGRLIKGYGATNERGKRNLEHIVTHLADPAFGSVSTRVAAIREAREAALADEAGQALDRTLARHGAPARPVVAQPIRFVRRASQP